MNKKYGLPEGLVYLDEVNKDILIDVRYNKNCNILGRKVKGYYNNIAVLTEEAALALSKVSDDFKKKNYKLVVYESYRPLKASQDFTDWTQDINDIKMKDIFYPDIDKKEMHKDVYIAQKSAHSRASTIDLTIIKDDHNLHEPFIKKIKFGKKEINYYDDGTLFMGTALDFMGQESHTKNCPTIEIRDNRALLLETMYKHGFVNEALIDGKNLWTNGAHEWWHYTLKNEPFADKYFDFDLKDFRVLV